MRESRIVMIFRVMNLMTDIFGFYDLFCAKYSIIIWPGISNSRFPLLIFVQLVFFFKEPV